jgi:Leucine-rich repeat (LRR) protein
MENEPNHTAAPPGPDWVQMHPVETAPSRVPILAIVVAAAFVISLAGVGALQTRRALRQEQKQTAYKNSYTVPSITAYEEEAFSGMLGEMVSVVFGKEAGSVTEQELAKIQWIADRNDTENCYLGYSFENPMENPDAELEWLTFPYRTSTGYENLYKFTGLKRLDTVNRLSSCNLEGLQLEGVTAYFDSFEEEAAALSDPGTIRELVVKGSIEQLDGIEAFSNVEVLSLYAGELGDVDALAALKQLRSLTSADAISDFSVLATAGKLEELSIDSESLKSLEFLQRMPQLKGLGLKDGEFIHLGGIEALAHLERLSIENCDELTDLSSVASLVSLRELTLDKPYKCPEPSLEELVNLQRLTLEGFDTCEFLPRLTNMEELVLRSCNLSSPDLSGLTKLRKLTCTSYGTDRSYDFITGLATLEELNLSGVVTYEDVSGIFSLPQLKKLNISGIECEINFDKITDNPSLETLEMAGVKLYENVQIEGGYGIVSIDWDDVYLADHTDFVAHFPNLKKLDVADNKLENIDFAAALVKLEEIDLSDNYVTELHALAELPSLRQVNCKGNPVSNLRVLDEEKVHIISQ